MSIDPSRSRDSSRTSRGRRDHRADAARGPHRGQAMAGGRCRRHRPGVTTDEIDAVGHEFLLDHGAYPRPWATGVFPSRCAPRSTRSSATASRTIGVWTRATSSTSTSRPSSVACTATPTRPSVGEVDEESRLLVERTHEAMMRAITAANRGRQLNVIGRVIESYARASATGVVRDFTGHGIGTEFHSGLMFLTTTRHRPMTPSSRPG